MSQEKRVEAEKRVGEPIAAPPAAQAANPTAKPIEGAVEGLVATASGPLANAVVRIPEVKVTTDSKGKFVIEHLPIGSFSLLVDSPTARFRGSTTVVRTEAERRVTAFIFLGEAVGTIDGDVVDEKGNSLREAEVSGLFHATHDAEAVKVDEKGHFSIKDVPPGTHFLRAKAPGFMTEGQSVEVVGNAPSTCRFVLKPGLLSIAGKVTDSQGRGVEAEVYLMKGGVVVERKKTKSGEGDYAFRDLVPANFELTVVAPGLGPKGWMGKLEKDEVVDFRLEVMSPATGPDWQSRFQ